MNFLFRKLFRNYIEPEQEANFLVKESASFAYDVFMDEQFRKLVNFGKQNRGEQDRIFNEIAVTALVFVLLMLEDLLPHIKQERNQFWQHVREKMPLLFAVWLKDLNIPLKYVKIWGKLLDKRLDEYKRGQIQTGQTWAKEISDEDMGKSMKDAAARLETVTVLSMLHITRGKAPPDDPLRKYLRTWLSTIDAKMAKRIGW